MDEREGMNFGTFTTARPLLILTALASSSVFGEEYLVRLGDTLSSIGYRFHGLPTYGPKGSFNKLRALNPEILNPDIILPGQRIKVSELQENTDPISSTQPIEPQLIEPQSIAPQSIAPQSIAPEPSQSVFIVPQLIYTRIDALDKLNGGRLQATDGNIGFRLGYTQKWSEKISLFAIVNWYQIDLKSPLASGTTVSRSAYTGFTVGTRITLPGRWVLSPALGYQQEPVVTAVSLTNLVIDRAGLIEAGASLSHPVSTSDRFSIWGDVGGALSLPTSTQYYDVSTGYVLYAKLTSRASLAQNCKLELGPFYRIQVLNTTLVDQTLTSLGIAAQFLWHFGQ